MQPPPAAPTRLVGLAAEQCAAGQRGRGPSGAVPERAQGTWRAELMRGVRFCV